MLNINTQSEERLEKLVDANMEEFKMEVGLEKIKKNEADEDKVRDEEKSKNTELDLEEIEKLEEQKWMEDEENLGLKHDLEALRKKEEKRITLLGKKVKAGELIPKEVNLSLTEKERVLMCLQEYNKISAKIKDFKMWEACTLFFPVVRPLRRYWERKLDDLILENYSYIICGDTEAPEETSEENQRKLQREIEEQKEREKWEELEIEKGLMKIREIEKEKLIAIKERIKRKENLPEVKRSEDVTQREKQLLVREYIGIAEELQFIKLVIIDWPIVIPIMKRREKVYRKRIDRILLENFYVLCADEDKSKITELDLEENERKLEE
ncbi:uncharacterized protein [Palaemon carinicauda]|uniref:uncharacterized protein n=1 Tax=Palaemon carinicauda TaxID=392227 RepID=UPI0035B60BDB